VGVVNEAVKTITVNVPEGTNITALAPVIVLSSPLATVSPASGALQNFTAPVVYTVTAEDGSTAQYTVTVTSADIGGENDITFVDSRGNEIVIPYGAMSCAAKVISFTPGEPWTSDARAMNPNTILGAPDYDGSNNYLNFGIEGEIVLEFGVYITDGAENDIYVFEVGPDVEPTKVEVSDDLINWVYVGDADGSLSGVDMNGKVPAGAKYRYVRLTETAGDNSTWPGADVDAAAAVHPVKIGSGNIDDIVEYTDSRGNEVHIPGGELSCATFVVGFTPGTPWTSDVKHQDPLGTIGAPNGDEPADGIGSLTMGKDGVLIVGFNVYITDGAGQDIYVFETGPDVEATRVEVSTDLETWIHVGDASGSLSGVDISGKVPVGAKYKYVRLTDLRTAHNSSYPGAEIDAVAALHPGLG
jgi:hypothetical protein